LESSGDQLTVCRRIAYGAHHQAFKHRRDHLGNSGNRCRVVRKAVCLPQGLERFFETGATPAVRGTHDRRDCRVARRLGNDFQLEPRCLGIKVEQHPAFGPQCQCLQHVLCRLHLGGERQQAFDFARDDGGDDRLLVRKVVVNVACTHA